MSLTSGPIPIAVVLVTIVALAISVDWTHPHRLRLIGIAVGVAAAVAGALYVVQAVFAVAPWDFSNLYFVWIGVVVLAIALAVISFLPRPVESERDEYARHARRGRASRFPASHPLVRTGRRSAAVLSVPLAALMFAALVNVDYDYYPTLASLTQSTNSQQTTLAKLNGDRSAAAQASGAATVAKTVQVNIPGTISHFTARPAYVWVPPVYTSGKNVHLPVVMMLSGSLGGPDDWLRAGAADTTAAAFAASHGGVAPILVFPDSNGSTTNDTECVDGPRGNAETYLTQDVPTFMAANFGTSSNRSWALAGLSGGGTCAVMLALRHPSLFVAFADYSGLTSPSPTDNVDRQASADALFGGDVAAYDAHDPLKLLLQRPPPAVAAIYEVSDEDKRGPAAQQTLVDLSRQAGLATCSWLKIGGAHNYKFWKGTWADSLPLLSADLHLTPAASFGGQCTPATHN